DSVESVVHADGVAQLPDQNAAEAVQRLPGVSVERDQGEGRFVSVRGLGPDLNSVTINGTLVPAPESDRRAVALVALHRDAGQALHRFGGVLVRQLGDAIGMHHALDAV
ncbi:TonB-dependent receptor plug domain-containing protein, partial [Pseudomonas otitidis]